MKKILILFLLLIKPIIAGRLLSKCFKSRSKSQVELTNLGQVETATNNNLDGNNQEQDVQERNRLLAKYLLLDEKDDFCEIRVFKVFDPLKIEKLEITSEEATEKLKSLCNETNDFTWHKFRHEAATLINSGANPNIEDFKGDSLLNSAVLYLDYFFVYFLLKRGSRINRHTLANAKTLKMTELLISHGANPRGTTWCDGDPLINTIVYNHDSKLFFLYIDKFKYPVNKKYLLHRLLRKSELEKKKVMILLSLGVNTFEKDDLDKTPIEIARGYLNSSCSYEVEKAEDFLEVLHKYNTEYNQIFRKTLILQTNDTLPLELQDYIYKFHAGEEAELFASKDS